MSCEICGSLESRIIMSQGHQGSDIYSSYFLCTTCANMVSYSTGNKLSRIVAQIKHNMTMQQGHALHDIAKRVEALESWVRKQGEK